MPCHVSPWIYPVWNSLCLLFIIDYFLLDVGEISNCNLLKNILISFISLLLSRTCIIRMLVSFSLFQRPLKLSSVRFFFFFFTLFCSSEFASNILSSSTLIPSSVSGILLLVPYKIILLSIIVLFVSLFIL